MTKKRKQYPSQARLRELFDYDPEGFLVWKYRPEMSKAWNNKLTGERAGSSYFDGVQYRSRITIDKKVYNALRLIWIYHHGRVPAGFFVKNRNLFNGLKIENMILSESQIKTHSGRYPSAIDGKIKGVSVTSNGNYRAKTTSKPCRDLGTYRTVEAAARVFDDWAVSYYGSGYIVNGSGCQNPQEFRVSGKNNQKQRLPPSGYKGVLMNPHYPGRSCKKWIARFYANKRNKTLGTFTTKEQAARAYNIAAYEHYGEQAVLNDIPDPLGRGDIF